MFSWFRFRVFLLVWVCFFVFLWLGRIGGGDKSYGLGYEWEDSLVILGFLKV